jgi:phage terminase Nu1 subunit (DNA packaging protein)
MSDGPEVFDSWKQIAAFLGRGIRTVQRWERTEGLPVHRHHHMKRGSVYALRPELTDWLQSRRGPRTQTDRNRHNLQEFDRLRVLARQQAALARELRQLLERHAQMGMQIRRAIP